MHHQPLPAALDFFFFKIHSENSMKLPDGRLDKGK